MRILKRWDSLEDVTPDELTRSDEYGPFTKGDRVSVKGRGRQKFIFHEHIINHTRDDEYVHLIGASKANLGRSYTIAPGYLVTN